MRPTKPAAARATPAQRDRVPGQLYHLRQVDPDLWTLVKVRAVQEGTTIRAVLVRALERYAAGREA